MATTIWRASDFSYTLQPVVTVMGHNINAQDFVADTSNMAGVTAFFVGDVDVTAAGRHTTPLILHRGERSVQTEGVFYVAIPQPYITVELGSRLTNNRNLHDIDPTYIIINHYNIPLHLLDFNHLIFSSYSGYMPVGEHQLIFTHNDSFFYTTMHVVDTTPPTAVLRDVTLPLGHEVTLDDILVSVFDLSPIAVTEIVAQPDMFTPGAHNVAVRVADIFGNEAIYTTTATFLPNTVPPVFYGVRQYIHSALGEPILFRVGVYASDAFNRPIHFDIDTGLLNINELGVYQITFTATDAWGLYTSQTIYVHIHNVDPVVVYALADDLLAQLFNDGMTQVQQARVIHDWLTDHVTYAAAVGFDSVYEAAHQGLIHRRGNCFVFFGLAEVLLTRAGIPNMRVDRSPYSRNPANHRWNLINPDGLGWHHFDPTGNTIISRNDRFMFTNSQLEILNQRMAVYGAVDFYMFDATLLPEIVQ